MFQHIPTVIIFDESYLELGRIIENLSKLKHSKKNCFSIREAARSVDVQKELSKLKHSKKNCFIFSNKLNFNFSAQGAPPLKRGIITKPSSSYTPKNPT